MPYIQKSIEVYKQFRGQKTEEYPGGIPLLVPVRGLYVSGTHTEPYFIDHNLTITNFTSNTMTVSDYTEIGKSINEGENLHLVGIDFVTRNRYVRFSSTSKDFNPESNIHLVGVDFVTRNRYTSFSTKNYNLNPESNIHLVGIDFVTRNKYGYPQSVSRTQQGPTHCLTIQVFTSNTITVSEWSG